MPIETRPWITREMVRAEPDTLFVFGDNLARAGMGGQAKEMRGEPNTVGIPTKRYPAMNYGAFFTNSDFDQVRAAMEEGWKRLAIHILKGGLVVFPADGIGTGLAELHDRAPRIARFIHRCTDKLSDLAHEQKEKDRK